MPTSNLTCVYSDKSVKLSGTLTKKNSQQFWLQKDQIQQWWPTQSSTEKHYIDVEALNKIDSAGLATLLALLKNIEDVPSKSVADVKFINIPRQMTEIVNANHLGPLLGI